MAKAEISTRDLNELTKDTNNIYKSVAIISKRARQISTKVKEELSEKLAEFSTQVDSLEEIFENKEQIEISRYYEKMPKPSLLATEQFLDGKVYSADNKDISETE